MTDAFLEFKSRPSSDTLISLLRACQGRVFRVCFQVLHNAHDAEDAAQGVLLKIVDEIRSFETPESFQRWLYRVSLNAALEAVRKASRRRVHEARAAMDKPAPKPQDPDVRLGLFEAIAALDDASRTFILDHYLEGEPLEVIARRAGCTPSGVSRRMERARETLRRRLAGSAAVLDFTALFAPSPSAPDLVTGAVLAKVQAVAALAAAGGIAMSKATIGAAFAIVAAVCLTGGTGLGYVMKSRSESSRVRSLETRLAVAEQEATTLRRDIARTSLKVIEKAPAPVKESGTPLSRRLESYKAWKKQWDADWLASQERFKTDDKFFQEMANRRDREKKEQFKGMRELACQEPQAFLDFLKEHQDYVTLNEVAEYGLIFEFMGSTGVLAQQFHIFPKELTSGLLDLLKTGSAVQKVVMLELFGRMHSPPQEFMDAYLAYLDDSEPSIQRTAVSCVSKVIPMTQELAQKLSAIGHASSDAHVRWAVTEALTYTRYPEAEDYLLERLETAKDAMDVEHSAGYLSRWYLDAATYAVPISEERYVRAAMAALGRRPRVNGLTAIARGALYLAPERARGVLQQVMSATSDTGLQEKLARMLAKFDAGQTRRDDLLQILHGYK